ncbi:DMT family transporter [Mucilaginibacter lutimaris]|uniref:DMT family transporter n=1 Tax=Mucilaginibacter lutimaris TaxID=931629 RepID=A0ABW2ZIC1_9SPHI
MYKNILPGLLFAVLWASGSVVVKFGILSADALLLACIRFICTGLIFAPLLLLQRKYRFWPKGTEWKNILVYGLLNTTLTLGSFFAAQKFVSAGIGMLFLAVAPLIIALFSALFLNRRLTGMEVTGMLIAFSGLVLASATGMADAHISVLGIILLLLYITSYAISSIYFSTLKLSMSNIVFNVWQVFIGGIILLPFCWVFSQANIKHVDANLFLSLAWMIVVLSFIANQLWLYLVKTDPVKAAGWLYLTPVFGYLYSYLLLGEKITIYAIAGTAMVIGGLVLSKRSKT